MQAAALSEGLVAQFVADTVSEPEQEWIRQPMPLGIRTAEHGNSALVRVVREALGTHRHSEENAMGLMLLFGLLESIGC